LTTLALPAAAAVLDRRKVAAWCLYDWANSSFPAIITTFVFATYFTQAVAPDPVTGTARWGHTLAFAGFVLAVMSPILGAAADLAGQRRGWLGAFTAIAVAATAGLWFVRPVPEDMMLALVLFAIATIAFETGAVFYNALLPSIAPRSHLGRVSGWGWGAGYVGGIVCLSLLLVGFVQAEQPWFGLDKAAAEHVRVAGPFAALWWAVFALPLLLMAREPGTGLGIGRALVRGLGEVIETLRHLPRHRDIGWFMLAHMLYADGLNTLFAFGAIYAAGSFGMDTTEVILFGIALNLTAGAGAFAFAWVDDRSGPKRTIVIALTALTAVSAALLLIESKAMFWVLGMLLGAFFGPVQAASRSYVARVAPVEMQAQMFGLFALSGRATAFLGPAILATVAEAMQSQRAGMATILIFFLSGLAVLILKAPEAPRAA